MTTRFTKTMEAEDAALTQLLVDLHSMDASTRIEAARAILDFVKEKR